MESKERKIRLPEYKRDFGNTEAEEMNNQFLQDQFTSFDRVEKASEFDDKVTKIDAVAYKEGRPFLAIQEKFTSSIDKLTETGKEILKRPLVQIHNNQGEVIDNEKIPLVMIHDKIEKWGEAYNKYLKEKLQNPLEALENKAEIKKKFLEQMIGLLKAERYYYPQHQEIFDSRISVLENELQNTR